MNFDDLNDRLRGVISALVLALYPGAEIDANRATLGDGNCIYLAGLRAGMADVRGERLSSVEFVAWARNISPEDAAGWCELWLSELNESQAPAGDEPEKKCDILPAPPSVEPSEPGENDGEKCDIEQEEPPTYGYTDECATDLACSQDVHGPQGLKTTKGFGVDDSRQTEPDEVPTMALMRPKVSAVPLQTTPAVQNVHKMLPSAIDAEKGLLSSFLQAPDEIGAICAEKGLMPGHFHDPAHTTIFEELQFLHGERMSFDFTIVTQNLRSQAKLQGVGGAAYVTELFTYAPTPAFAGAYLEAVFEAWAKRQIIEFGTNLVERSYDGLEEPVSVLRDANAQIEALLTRTVEGMGGDNDRTVPLIDLVDVEPDPTLTLLGNRYLCVGGGFLFVGPSGIGKSSASVQQDLSWGLGRPAFGIAPSRPLKILTIQAENDDGDLGEMARGVVEALGFSEEEKAILRKNVRYVTEGSKTGSAFLAVVDQLLTKHKPDILRIDPFMAYLGADVVDTEETAAFLRAGLNPLLKRHKCGVILNHHTPKVNNRDTSKYRSSDWMYAGAGGADVTNWARAVLVIDPTHDAKVFKFLAAKRGARIGWTDGFGEKTLVRHFCHAEGEALYWREATAEDVAAAEAAAEAAKGGSSKRKTEADMRALVPMTGSIPKNELLEAANKSDFSVNHARLTLKKMVEDRQLHEWRISRSGTNAQVCISRHEQRLTDR